MKQHLLRATILSLSLGAFGCLHPAAPEAMAPVSAPAAGTVTATAHLSIAGESGRQLLASTGVEPWKKLDIDHVNVALYQDGSTTPLVSQKVIQADLAGTVTFTSLRMNTSYKVEVKAWADSAETVRIDNLEADATSCTTTFSTTNNSVVDAGLLKLQLMNKVFSGTTDGSAIQVTDGIVENPAASEAMKVATPAPTYFDSMDPCDPTSSMYDPDMCYGII